MIVLIITKSLSVSAVSKRFALNSNVSSFFPVASTHSNANSSTWSPAVEKCASGEKNDSSALRSTAVIAM